MKKFVILSLSLSLSFITGCGCDKKDTTKENESTVKTEKLLKPVGDDVKIVKKFYDAKLSDEELEKALVYFEGVYRPNLGVDFSKDGKSFDVIAACSGTVTKKENDGLYNIYCNQMYLGTGIIEKNLLKRDIILQN